MKKVRKYLVMLAGLLALVSLAACGSTSSSSDSTTTEKITVDNVEGSLKGVSLKIGTSGLFAPYSYYDQDGKTLIGYDLDLVTELQNLLGFDIADDKIEAMPYASLITSITSNKLDLIAAGLSKTSEREKIMSFSTPYQEAASVVMVNKDDTKGITGPEDLDGKTIAVEKGTISHIYATEKVKDAKVEAYDTITAACVALEQGKVDAVLYEGPPAKYYLKSTPDTKLEIVGDEFDKGSSIYALGLQKDSPYKDNFDAALEVLTENGTMDKLNDKWLN